MILRKLQRLGGQTVVNIPKTICEGWDWRPGMYVKLLLKERDVLVIVRVSETERETIKGRETPSYTGETIK